MLDNIFGANGARLAGCQFSRYKGAFFSGRGTGAADLGKHDGNQFFISFRTRLFQQFGLGIIKRFFNQLGALVGFSAFGAGLEKYIGIDHFALGRWEKPKRHAPTGQ